MENFNGNITTNISDLSANRAFKYGDAIFDTLKYTNHQLEFLEDHYFRLMASMRLLRMEIPMDFTLEFYEQAILKSIDFSLNANQYRIRVTVFRANGGLYLPNSNKINYLIETAPLNLTPYSTYEVDVYKDFYLSSSFLSTIKTSNRILNVLASIYADENRLQNCLLVNDKKQIVEFINGNIFVVNNHQVITPPLSEGCVN
ncbi:MAG: aminotransferase class IV, partial [Flavobacteriaceae bacterium]|nr:aminotransferase class IV [Flavobacteriaceae bacterium]